MTFTANSHRRHPKAVSWVLEQDDAIYTWEVYTTQKLVSGVTLDPEETRNLLLSPPEDHVGRATHGKLDSVRPTKSYGHMAAAIRSKPQWDLSGTSGSGKSTNRATAHKEAAGADGLNERLSPTTVVPAPLLQPTSMAMGGDPYNLQMEAGKDWTLFTDALA